jgi:hypothetical protein
MANPDSAGRQYGKAALEKLGVWASVESRYRADSARGAGAGVAR